MKRYIGKYASGQRKADEQMKRERDFIKSLPLAIRKAMKERNDALAAYNIAVSDKAEREFVISLGQAYRTLDAQVNEMIKEHRNA